MEDAVALESDAGFTVATNSAHTEHLISLPSNMATARSGRFRLCRSSGVSPSRSGSWLSSSPLPFCHPPLLLRASALDSVPSRRDGLHLLVHDREVRGQPCRITTSDELSWPCHWRVFILMWWSDGRERGQGRVVHSCNAQCMKLIDALSNNWVAGGCRSLLWSVYYSVPIVRMVWHVHGRRLWGSLKMNMIWARIAGSGTLAAQDSARRPVSARMLVANPAGRARATRG